MSRERYRSALRTAAPAAAVTFLAGVLTIYLMPYVWYVDDFTWFVGTWMQLAMSQRAFLLVLVPLGLVLGARQARRAHRAAATDQSAVNPASWTASVLVTGLAVVVGYLAAGLIGGARILGTARYLTPEVPAVVAVGALALLGVVWLGVAAGRRWPGRATAPLLGGAAFVLLLFLDGWLPGWVALLLSPIEQMAGPDDYATVPGRVSAAQALWFAGLAGTALLLAVAVHRRTRIAAVLPVLAGVVLASAVMPRQEAAVTSATDPVARELVCAEQDARVCVSRVHAGLLDEFVPPAREALALLAKLPNAPTGVHDDDPDARSLSQPGEPGVILTQLRAVAGTRRFSGGEGCYPTSCHALGDLGGEFPRFSGAVVGVVLLAGAA